MADRLPALRTNSLAAAGQDDTSATDSPARGAEMRSFLQQRLQARVPPLVHSWEFWYDRQDRAKAGEAKEDSNYEDRLVKLSDINDVGSFWTVFNNFDVTAMPLRNSIHLFHKGVKPIWEDPRNEKGGAWTFRVQKANATEYWKELCMMAIGEKLQAAVESERKTFRDDICGISLGVRFNSILLQVWNRDGEHTEGIDKILKTVLDTLPSNLQPREGTYYYKKHSEHTGFSSTESKS